MPFRDVSEEAPKGVVLGNQYPGEYDVYVFATRVDYQTFDRWLQACRRDGVVDEGMVTQLTREELVAMLGDTNNFVASADVFVQALLNE